jgi:hypothetical protein
MNQYRIKINNLNMHLKNSSMNNINSIPVKISENLLQYLNRDKTSNNHATNKFVRNIDIKIKSSEMTGNSNIEDLFSNLLSEEIIKKIKK